MEPFLTQASAYFFGLILLTTIVFFIILLVSIIKNRDKIHFYTLIVRENNRISKVGLSFIAILLIIVYQAIFNKEITPGLIELLGIIFTAEIGTNAVNKGTKAYIISKTQKPVSKKADDQMDIGDINDL